MAMLPLLTLLQKPLDSVVGKTFFDLEYPMALAQRLAREIAKVIETKQADHRGHAVYWSEWSHPTV